MLVKKVKMVILLACAIYHSRVKIASKAGNWDWVSPFLFTPKGSLESTLQAWKSEWIEEQDFTDRVKGSPTNRKDAEIQGNENLGSQW